MEATFGQSELGGRNFISVCAPSGRQVLLMSSRDFMQRFAQTHSSMELNFAFEYLSPFPCVWDLSLWPANIWNPGVRVACCILLELVLKMNLVLAKSAAGTAATATGISPSGSWTKWSRLFTRSLLLPVPYWPAGGTLAELNAINGRTSQVP